MTVTALGSLTVAAAVPGMYATVIAGASGINAVLPGLAAELAALSAIVPTPTSPTAQLAQVAQITASINAGITAGLPVPDVIGILAALIAELSAKVGSLNAQLAIVTGFNAALATGGIAAFAYDGAVGSLGAELGAAVGGGPTHANALALVTTDPAAWAALGAVMKVTP